jgi:hypothetical protein
MAPLVSFALNSQASAAEGRKPNEALVIVTNVASIRGRIGAPGEMVITAGYYAANDGGATTYVWDASDNRADDGGAVIRPAALAAPGSWVIVLADGVANVRCWGARGDGTADDTAALQACADFCFGPSAAPHGRDTARHSQMYIPAGTFNITKPIAITYAHGVAVMGAGRFSTNVINVSDAGCVVTNGFEYSRVSGIHFGARSSSAVIFDLNWDGKTVALQSNTFSDCYFSGGDVGVRIGRGDFMGSENLFLNCYFSDCGWCGLQTSNYNALQNTVIGGNFSGCGYAVHMRAGTVSCYSVGFQRSAKFDIRVDNTANDAIVISGCRTESQNFFIGANGIVVKIVGCSQPGTDPGIFAKCIGTLSLDSCISLNGQVLIDRHVGTIVSSRFGRVDWLKVESISQIYILNTTYGYATKAQHISSKVIDIGGGLPRTTERYYIPLPSDSGSANFPIHVTPSRVIKVTLILDTPSSAGTVSVGDSESRTTYFKDQPLTHGNVASVRTDKLYGTPDQINVVTSGAMDVVGYVAVDIEKEL